MAECAIGVRQRRVRRVPEQRMAKAVLHLAGEPRVGASLDELALHQGRERDLVAMQHGVDALDALDALDPEERREPAWPEGFSEDARRAKDLALLAVERLEPRLQHGEHGAGQLVAGALGDGPDQLL